MAERGNIQSLNIAITANPDGLKKGLDDAVKAVQAAVLLPIADLSLDG